MRQQESTEQLRVGKMSYFKTHSVLPNGEDECEKQLLGVICPYCERAFTLAHYKGDASPCGEFVALKCPYCSKHLLV